MRSHVTRILLAFGVWFGGAGAHLQATERAPADVYDYAGRFRLGQDGVVTFFVTAGDLYMTSLQQGVYELQPRGNNRYSSPNGELVVTFYSDRLVEITTTNGMLDAMAVRMADDEKVPLEHIMDGNLDEAIRAYLIAYEEDLVRNQLRGADIQRAAAQLRAEGKIEQSLMLLGLLSLVYPEEAVTFRGLGDVYLSLAIENYREYARLSGELDTRTPALEFMLENED